MSGSLWIDVGYPIFGAAFLIMMAIVWVGHDIVVAIRELKRDGK